VNDNEAPLLRLERGDAAGIALVPPSRVLCVGRSTQADFVVADDSQVSAMHFRLEHHESAWWIHDLESSNGTYVNGERVRASVVRDEDRIVAGNTAFRVRLETATVQVSDVARIPRIDTIPPFVVGSAYSEDQHGGAWLSVVVKGTWTIDERPVPAASPVPIFISDQLASDDPASPVRFESDLVPFKPRADVVLVGHAYAPSGEPVTQLFAGVRVGQLSHAIAVFGDREWRGHSNQLPTFSAPRPFAAMELVYERAFGGIDGPAGMYCMENLVGTGFIGKNTRERVDHLRLPNLEDRRNLITSWDSRPRPVGFGFYGRGWMPRLAYAGTYDEQYVSGRYPLPPVDFSYRFFNGAHPDLQVDGYLGGGEEVTLLNVCPETPDMRFRLPGLVPRVAVGRWNGSPDLGVGEPPLIYEPITTVLDTLVFMPDEGVFYEVFRGRCRLASLDSLEIAQISVRT
jgi:hypothetical protein